MQYHDKKNIDIIFKPIKSQDKLSQQIYKSLLEIIISGQIEPGKHLPVDYFSEKLGVSSTPIKEAFNKLQSKGLLINIPYRGFEVRRLSTNEIRNIYETRTALESFAVRLTCRRITEKAKIKLALLQKRGKQLCEEEDYKAYMNYNKQLHNLIIGLSNNDTLIKMFKTLEYQIDLIISRTIKLPGRPNEAVREHSKIVESILIGDEKTASNLVEQHISNAMKDYLKSKDAKVR